MKSNNAAKTSKSTAINKSASRSSKPKRSNSVPKNPVFADNGKATDELDGNIVCTEGTTLQGEASAIVLEKAGTAEGTGGTDLPGELTAITLHQPWASLIAEGKKNYETRSWAIDYRGLIAIHAAKKLHEDESLISLLEIPAAEIPLGAVVAIAELTDCILMDEEFILKQSSFEQYLGLWEVGCYAWKLENVRAIEPIPVLGKQGLWKWKHQRDWQKKFFGIDDSIKYLDSQQSTVNSQQLEPWNPADFGELHHVAETDGQLNLLEWLDEEPPDPNDYEFREEYDERLKEWAARQTNQPKESTPVFTARETYELYTGNDASELTEELCNQLMDGSTCVQESAQGSPTQASNCGEEALITSASGTAIAAQSLPEDSPASTQSTTSKNATSNSAAEYSSLLLARLAPHSQLMETDSEPTTPETFSPTCSEQSENSSPTLQLSKTLLASSLTPTPPATNPEPTSDSSSTPYPRAGTMRNGVLSAAPILPPPGVESESLLLRSPGGLSSGENTRPPGKSRLETQLNQLGLIQDGEVAAPEFLEAGYQLPAGFTNPEEQRTALELSQVQAQLSSNLELQAETEPTAIVEQPWAMPSIGGSPLSDLNELIISLDLPPNIGALTKNELISMAGEQHQFISSIERKEFELALEKLYRARLTGVYLQEFKKKCQHGEFQYQLEQAGIGIRSAQNYMVIAKNWEIVEAKTKLVALLTEENQPAIGLKWALEAVRDEKKQLKSAAPPKDPDGWRTPNTKDQPIVDLVKKALGGQIWLDPCSGSVTNNIPCAVRYFKDDNGLAQHQTWSKTVFINPPFSDPLPWVERCCFEIARGNVSAAVMLLKSGTISNLKTGELINKYASAICHWRGRINFLNDEGNAVKGSDFDCVFIYFGARLDLFRQAFGGRGTIATIENHYSSVNKKFMTNGEKAEFGNVEKEQKQLAAAVGLKNGRSGVLPDMRDRDRELAERHDPYTVIDVLSVPPSMPTPATPPAPVSEIFQPIAEIFDETPLATRQFEKAKENCLNDYITAISSNLSEFSDDQIAFLAKIINEESVKRIRF
jgi:hypothetical protein